MENKLKELINRSKIIHNNKYDYVKCNQVNYKNIKNEIICPKHGSFYNTWDYHINNNKSGCTLCRGKKPTRDRKQWIERCNKIHNNTYDYSITDFGLGVMALNKVICVEHGAWNVTIDNHVNKKSKCPKCSGYKWDIFTFIQEAEKIHGKKYNYSKSTFISQSSKIEIVCCKHGSFYQTPHHHIYQKNGCYECGKQNRSVSNTKTLEKVKLSINEVHSNTYTYDFSKYKNALSKIDITCSKHGVFTQKLNNHLLGQGCPSCKSSMGELKVKQWLENNNIEYIPQYKFSKCLNIKLLPFDFYIPKCNICIEFDGEQHFKPITVFGGDEAFGKIQLNDSIKNKFCIENGIRLLRIKYDEINNIPNILNSYMLEDLKKM